MSTEIAPDGSPVEVYRRLPSRGEAKLIHAAIPDGGSILELGCGAGRVTHELIGLGHPVTAVDESGEMLALVRGAETVRSAVEELELGRTFAAVVLGSHLVNEADRARRRRVLDTCARQVSPDGSVLVESYATTLDWGAAVGRTSVLGDVAVTVVRARVEGPLVNAVVAYVVDGRSWRQAFSAWMLDEEELASAFRDVGLEFVRWLNDARTWSETCPCENRAP